MVIVISGVRMNPVRRAGNSFGARIRLGAAFTMDIVIEHNNEGMQYG